MASARASSKNIEESRDPKKDKLAMIQEDKRLVLIYVEIIWLMAAR